MTGNARPSSESSERRRQALLLTDVLPSAGATLSSIVLRERSVAARWALAIGATVLAAIGSVLLAPYLERVLFILFWPAVIYSALIGGFRAAVLSSVISVLVVDRVLLGQVGVPDAADVAPLAIFLLASLTISSITNALRAASARQVQATRELHQLSLDLEEQATELEQQLEESQALQQEVEETSSELAARTTEAEAASAFSQGILASLADPFVVHDADWRFLFINAPAREIIRRSRGGAAGDLLGQRLWDAYPELVGTEHEREMRRAAEQRVPVTYEAFLAEAGTWSIMSCYPLPDGGLATQWRDVTERRRAEESARYLARASDVLAASLDYDVTLRELAQVVVPELAEWCTVYMVEPDASLRVVAIAHADPAKVRWAWELEQRYPTHPDADHGVPRVLRTGRAELLAQISDEMLAARAEDDEHLGMLTALDLRSAMLVPLVSHDRVLGVLTLVTGRTGRRYTQADLDLATELARRAALAVDNSLAHRAEIQARIAADEANAAKVQFLAVMSHELRTPLNAIGGYADLMRLGLRGPVTEAQAQDLDRIVTSQRNLLWIINDILNFAKIDAGHLEFQVTAVPVVELMREVEELIAPQLLGAALTLEEVECAAALVVRGDREKIRQILLNLLSNAIKFTERGGRITVTCSRHGAAAHIEVRDTGIGIAADRLHTVFDPFVQLDRTLTSQHEGTGLGLAISRELARAMQGDITAASTAGVGSAFTVVLPLTGE